MCPLHAVVNGQLSAEFSATQYSGCAPVIINFTDASKGAPQNWKWVVTDASSTLIASAGTKSFVTNFSKEGSYDVKLLVTNGSKQDSVIKKIIVYAKPSVSFTEDIITGCFPLKTNFKETGSIGQGGITKWEWDFGDGKSASTNNSFNTYTTAGSFNVSLRLTSDKGCSDVLTKSNLIQINKGALARFSAIPLGLTCKYPEEVSFKNTSTGTGTLKYVWDFGTGDTAHSINANHTYTYQGLYNVTLRVSNDAGCADTLIIKDAVTVGSANAAFTSPASVCAGSILSLQNVSTQGTTSSHWTFGDNTFSDSINPVKKFTNPGIFGIQLINTFANCVDTASYTVIVQPGPVVSFSSLQTSDCQIPSQFTFTNTSQNATNYSWDFGNGSTSTQQNPTAIFNTPGKYNIKLVATTSRGCTDSLTRSEYIQVYQLTTDNITGVPYSGCAPYRTVFRPQFNNLFPGDVVTAYKWDLGNGSTSTAAQPPVTYNDPGEYTVKLSIETARGCKADFVFDTTIHLPHTPIAQFSASPDTACGAGPVYFVNETQSVDSVIKWTWIFGDGGTSHAKDPVSYGYDFTGSFRPVLIADIRGCKDTSASQTIFVKGPIAHHAVIFPDCNFPFRRTFNNFSVGTIVSYDWDFGDGSPHSFVANPPPHDYPNITATYQTSLTITGVNGCPPQKNIRDTRIIARTAGFNYSSEVCNLDSASFSVTGILPTDVKNFTWLFGDGKSITTDGAQVEIKHKYKDSKKYTATLIVLDIFNCTQIITHVISVNGPSAKFNNPANACVNSNVSFSDLSTITNGNPIMQYQWQFGDNTPDSIVTAKKIIHSYSAGGDYTIKLVITDTKGCTDTTMGKLSISDPKANFNLKDSIFCPNSDILFANTSTGTSLTSSWNFGDGKTSAQKDPVHNYKLINSYIISLKVTDGIGCTNTITSNLRIDTPKAHFTIDTSVAICPPLKVLFTNQSTSYASAEWTFGDGDALSILKDSVSHIYNTPGTFYPTLKVYGNGGCSSSYKNDSISIKGPFGIFTYDPLTACAGVNSISFHVTNQNDVAIYNWDFGGRNGLAQTADPDIKHVFDSAMSFVPFVILQNRQGCQFRLDGKEPIKIQNVSARISKLQQNVFCGTGSVEFHDASFSVNDTPVSWQWNFGDGNTSSLTNPIHDFKNPGIYPVTLMVSTENGCRDITSLEIPVKVVIQPVIAITGDSTGCTPATLNFKGE
ncbi:MAG: hypothetical protein JWN76_268, partial [Chitinophagaceae bacterium]|nr:hypothetical protein [Chitinophagaceae bacterium]